MSAAVAFGFDPATTMVLGIASTAMPFAPTPEAEAERWLRILRLHGKSGVVLQALGVSEGRLQTPVAGRDPERGTLERAEDLDMVGQVVERATLIARRRDAATIATTDVLLAVMYVYGADFDRVLRAHGTDRSEVTQRLLEVHGV